MRADDEFDGHLALAENFDGASFAAGDAGDFEFFRANSAARGELSQVAHVDHPEFDAEWISKPAPIRQLADERQLAAFEIRRDAASGARVLAFCSLTASFDLAAAVPATDTNARAGRANRRPARLEQITR